MSDEDFIFLNMVTVVSFPGRLATTQMHNIRRRIKEEKKFKQSLFKFRLTQKSFYFVSQIVSLIMQVIISQSQLLEWELLILLTTAKKWVARAVYARC